MTTSADAMVGLKPPQPLKINPNDMASAWKDFKQQFMWYATATNLKTKSPEVQAAVLMTTIGPDAANIFNTFQLKDEEAKDMEVLIKKFEDHFSPKQNESFTRWNFFRLKQSSNETFEEFLTEAKTKMHGCNFGMLADGLLRDKIVYGVHNDQVREKLLAEQDLTLEKAIQVCRISEQASKQLKQLTSTEVQIDRVQHKRRESNIRSSGNPRFKTESNDCRFKTETYECQRCGTKHHARSCPAYKKRCRRCQKVGHFSKKCKSKQIHVVNDSTNDNVGTDSNSELYLDSVSLHLNIDSVNSDWYETVKLSNKSVRMKLDTGAQCNVISYELAKEINVPIVKTKVKKLISFSNHEMKVMGEINADVKIKNKSARLKFIVADSSVKPIIGGETCVQLGLIKRIMSAETETLPADWKTNIFEGLGCLKDYYYDIDLEKNAEFDICPPRKIPYALKDVVKKEIDRMVELNVIEPITEPSYAVSPLVIVKKNNKIRVCIDPSKLNKFVKRRHFPLKTMEEIAGKIKGAKVFALLDCKRGFWQLRVTDRTSRYLTINTPWGRFAYKRIPFGLVSAPEIYQQKMSELLQEFENVECSMDDILIFADSESKLQELVDKVMKKLFLSGLRLNKDKCVLSAQKVKFLGHILDENGISPDPEKIEAIHKLQPPTNVKELRRFLGLANYLGKFIPNFSHVSEPLRRLLEKDVEWEWSDLQNDAFVKIKELISSAPVLGYYNVNDPVTVTVDASSTALGAVLSQRDKPIAYATRSLTKAEKNYPQIEKEALAMRFGCKKFHQYIYGKNVTIETDHKPLEIIGKKSITQAPPRLQRIFYDILQYNPTIVYKKGTTIPVADALSRDCLQTESEKEDDTFVVHLVLPMSENALSDFKREEQKDPELIELKKVIQMGWADEKSSLPSDVQKYWNFRDELSLYDGLVFKGERIVVPKQLQNRLLNLVHQGHLGIQSSLRRARESFYWYGMTSDIVENIKKCKVCQSTQSSKPKETVLMKPIPEYPFQRVASDLFEYNKRNYIVIADSYSGFYDFHKLKRTTSVDCINILKRWFAVHGIPEVFESDNGSQYASKTFRKFLYYWGIKQEPSSPYHPQSNGLAERAVEASKILLRRCHKDNSDIALALINLRNTPRENGLMSINQRLMSRTTRSLLPTTKRALKPKVVENGSELLEYARQRKTNSANKHLDRRTDSTINPGDQVRVQVGHRSWIGGEIESMVNPRSAIINTGDRRVRRNTAHVAPTSTRLPSTRRSLVDFDSSDNSSEVVPSPPSPPVVVPQLPPVPPTDTGPLTRTRTGRVVRPPKRLDL